MKCRSDYEESAHRQIQEWKNPEQSWFDKAMAVVSWPLDRAGEALMNTPGLGPAIQKAFSGIVGTINDTSQWSVRPAAILQEYRRFGHADISTLAEIHHLDLSAVDRAIGWLDTKYEGIAIVEGAAAGGASVFTPATALAVIPVDVGAYWRSTSAPLVSTRRTVASTSRSRTSGSSPLTFLHSRRAHRTTRSRSRSHSLFASLVTWR